MRVNLTALNYKKQRLLVAVPSALTTLLCDFICYCKEGVYVSGLCMSFITSGY
ncbi:hypothetical protein PSM_A2345 [Pseudoalteromonas sp. SM9913]|nr:hypothetical protein PSM_A2345 [Pseudoalteromonas sp. SM9913]